MIDRALDSNPTLDGDSLVTALRGAIDRHGDRIALIDGVSGASVSYRELGHRIDRIAGWLDTAGVRRGDRIALWSPNTPPFAAFTFAAFELGATVTMIGASATDPEVEMQLRDAGARVVVAAPALAERALALGAGPVVALGAARGAVSLVEVLERGPARPRDVHGADPGGPALLPYSSGTTGLPKGVVLTHRNLVVVCRQIQQALEIRERDVTLAVAPFAHILGITAELLVPLVSGAAVVTVPRFAPVEFIELLERHRVTYLAVPPPIAMALAEMPLGDRDLSSLELIAVGGAPLPDAVHHALERRLPRCSIGQGWGLTETSGAISLPNRSSGSRPGTVGRPLLGTEVRAVDIDSGVDQPPGSDGELWVRGPQIMAGYLGRPDATAAMIDADGWLRTGDLGHIDDDGSVVIVDRLKELIKVNAFQVAPAEVEAALVAHPDIRDAAVVGRPDPRKGEVPVAYVVARCPVERAALDAWLTPRRAHHKRPVDIIVVEQLPRTPSGKLRRQLLRDRDVVSSSAAKVGSSISPEPKE
jgi:acyl-CoA synthetase (AMP-forming)/AMP-acid ligase II